MFIKALAGAAIAAATLSAGAVQADPQPNFIIGTSGKDVLIGTRHNDFIAGRRGDDRLVGLRGNDTLVGGPGNDILRAAWPFDHSGKDVLRGGLGRDDLCIGDASDVFRGCETVRIRG